MHQEALFPAGLTYDSGKQTPLLHNFRQTHTYTQTLYSHAPLLLLLRPGRGQEQGQSVDKGRRRNSARPAPPPNQPNQTLFLPSFLSLMRTLMI